MRISDWSSDVCSSDLAHRIGTQIVEDALHRRLPALQFAAVEQQLADADIAAAVLRVVADAHDVAARQPQAARPLNLEEEEFGGIGGPSDFESASFERSALDRRAVVIADKLAVLDARSEEHPSELQSLMRITYA